MVEKIMRNNQINAIFNIMVGEIGKSVLKKKLPSKLLYALNRSIPEIEKARKALVDSIDSVCASYDADKKTLKASDESKQEEFMKELNDLLNTETTINVHTVSSSILDAMDNGNYDSLTYGELDAIMWVIDED